MEHFQLNISVVAFGFNNGISCVEKWQNIAEKDIRSRFRARRNSERSPVQKHVSAQDLIRFVSFSKNEYGIGYCCRYNELVFISRRVSCLKLNI